MVAITGQFQRCSNRRRYYHKRQFVNRERKLDEEECVRVSGLVESLADFILAATPLKLRSLSPLRSASSSDRSSLHLLLVRFPRVKSVKSYVSRLNIFMDISCYTLTIYRIVMLAISRALREMYSLHVLYKNPKRSTILLHHFDRFGFRFKRLFLQLILNLYRISPPFHFTLPWCSGPDGQISSRY